MVRRSTRVRLGRIASKRPAASAAQGGEQEEWPELPRWGSTDVLEGSGAAGSRAPGPRARESSFSWWWQVWAGGRQKRRTGALECTVPMQFTVVVISLSGAELLVTTCDETTSLRELRVRLTEAGIGEAYSSKFFLGDVALGGSSTLLSPFAVDGCSITIQSVVVRNYLRCDGLYRLDTDRDVKIFLRFYEEGQAILSDCAPYKCSQTAIAVACGESALSVWQWTKYSPIGRLVRPSSQVEWIARGSYEINAETIAFDLVGEEDESVGEREFVVRQESLEMPDKNVRYTFLPLDDMEYTAVRAASRRVQFANRL